MYNETDIRLGKGIGDLLFGSSREEVRAYLGEPNEVGQHSYDGEGSDRYETWKYADLGILATFDEEDEFVLGTLSVYSDTCLLNGRPLIGKARDEVLKAISALNPGAMTSEDMSSEDDLELLSFDSISLNLWLVDGVVNDIQWSPFWLDEEHQDWPK
jgi:hypothetical protein